MLQPPTTIMPKSKPQNSLRCYNKVKILPSYQTQAPRLLAIQVFKRTRLSPKQRESLPVVGAVAAIAVSIGSGFAVR